jgi:hypothetical protein
VLRIEAVAAGGDVAAVDDRVRLFAGACGWDVEVARQVEELDPPTESEVLSLRNYDPEGLFLN